MDKKFIAKCDRELIKNNAKGNWEEWNPNIKVLTQELSWHHAKLCSALLSGELENIKEYSADVANICEKAFIQASIAKKSRKEVYDCYGDFIGYEYPNGVGFNVGQYK